MNLLDRARSTMTMLQRAPGRDEPQGDTQLSHADAVSLFDETLDALDFFEPHFQTYDEIMAEAGRSFWYRLFHSVKIDGMDKLRELQRSFRHYRDVVQTDDSKTVTIDAKIVTAAHGWISWRDLEVRRTSGGPYR